MNFGSTSLRFFLHPSPQGVVPVRHQLPSCETQQPRRVGDQTGNGTGKQFLGSDVPEKGLLHSRRVGLNLTYLPMFFYASSWEVHSFCTEYFRVHKVSEEVCDFSASRP